MICQREGRETSSPNCCLHPSFWKCPRVCAGASHAHPAFQTYNPRPILLQLLAEENLTASQRDLVNTIRCSGETLLILITDILDFSRIEANKMVLSLHEFRLRTVAEAAMEIAGLSCAEKRLQVGRHSHGQIPFSADGSFELGARNREHNVRQMRDTKTDEL